MSEAAYNFAVGVLNLVGLFIVASLSVWLAFRRYQNEQNWSKAITIYSETIVSLSGINRIVSEWISEKTDPTVAPDADVTTARGKEFGDHVKTLLYQVPIAKLYLDDATANSLEIVQKSLGIPKGNDDLIALNAIANLTQKAITEIVLAAKPHTKPLPIIAQIKLKARDLARSKREIPRLILRRRRI